MLNEQKPVEAETKQTTNSIGARLVPWLIVLALALLFIPLYLTTATLDDMTAPLASEEVTLAQTLTAPPPVPTAEQTLTARLLEVETQLGALSSLPPTLIAAHVDWPAIMSTIRNYDANEIHLSGFDHITGKLTLQGAALQEDSVMSYAHTLEQTGLFSQVRIQSITVNPVSPATPNLATTPTSSPVLSETYMPIIFTISINLNEAGS